MSKPADADVIAAIATPPGRGGLGIVRVSGPDLDRVIDRVVSFKRDSYRRVIGEFRKLV